MLRPGARAGPAAAHRDLSYLSYLRADALSAIFLLATGFLYAAVAVYAVGYLEATAATPGTPAGSTPG